MPPVRGARSTVRPGDQQRAQPRRPRPWQVALSNSLGFALYENFKDVLQVDDRKPPWRRAPIAPMHQLDGARKD